MKGADDRDASKLQPFSARNWSSNPSPSSKESANFRSVIGHLLPNVIGPVLVIATINLATAILTEATLSFLGVGLPPTEPSLGTMIRVGNDFLLSGDWWISIFPGIVLALLILSVNLLGDWLRDAFNPKLR